MPTVESDVKMRILQTAKRLFAKQGFDATSVRQICEEASVNVALISYYFGGKENVLKAMLQEFMPISRLPEFEDELQDPVIGIRRIIREVVGMRYREPELISIVQQEIALMSSRIAFLQEFTFPLWSRFRDLLAEGRKRGVFEFESLDNTLMFALGALLMHKQRDYFRFLMTEPEKSLSLEEMVTQTTEFIFHAVKYKGD
ncbi:TetR/AcrR family transcriptional regulator [Paenibacillus chartarius]|uniref:TetR/AcrR family transcriptional regulator n=1 Tax=Paenibacillus chartarius TaxID=747481 RepID=A0ABV6DI23_9BACL